MTTARMWVFGYGSLMWQPDFACDHHEVARLDGYARSFCMWSIHHRGSRAEPGLVLALDRHDGALCHGLALRVADGAEDETLALLRERELVSSAYLERLLPVRLAGGQTVEAVTYIVDPDHEQYCGNLPLAEQAQIIAHAHGGRGPNSEYLFNTVDHLEELGMPDADLTWLVAEVRRILAGAS